jgi:hypothetical protein
VRRGGNLYTVAHLEEPAILSLHFRDGPSGDPFKAFIDINEWHVRQGAVCYGDAFFDAVHSPIFQMQQLVRFPANGHHVVPGRLGHRRIAPATTKILRTLPRPLHQDLPGLPKIQVVPPHPEAKEIRGH